MRLRHNAGARRGGWAAWCCAFSEANRDPRGDPQLRSGCATKKAHMIWSAEIAMVV